MSSNIEKIRRNFFKQKFLSELKYLKQMHLDEPDPEHCIENRINQLESIIKNLIESQKKQRTLNEMLDEINDCVYHRPWKKLQSFHQVEKIKEYIENNTKYSEKKKKRILPVLVEAADDNKLNKKDMVNYNPSNAAIISIPCLKYSKKNDKYFIKR